MLVRVLWKYQVSKQNQLLQQKVTQSEKEENLSKMLDLFQDFMIWNIFTL